MSNKILFKRGLKNNLPLLAESEPAFCIDTNEVFIGSSKGNFKLADYSTLLGVKNSLESTGINIKDFGAIGDGNSHILGDRFSTLALAKIVYPNAISLGEEIDTIAIQSAFDYANTNKKRVVICPLGTYIINKQINAYSLISIIGSGYDTEFKLHGCNGFVFQVDTDGSKTLINNFRITSAGFLLGMIGLKFDGTSSMKNIHYGYSINNVMCYYLDTFISLKTAWHFEINGCLAIGCYNGILIKGQCVSNIIDKFIYDGSHANTPSSSAYTTHKTGISVKEFQYNESKNRPESLRITSPYISSAYYGIYWNDCLYGVIENADIDYITGYGIWVNHFDGGLHIQNVSIYLYTNGLCGLYYEEKPTWNNGMSNVDNLTVGAWDDTDLANNSCCIKISTHNTNIKLKNIHLGISVLGRFFRGIWIDNSESTSFEDITINENQFTGDCFRCDNSIISVMKSSHDPNGVNVRTKTKINSNLALYSDSRGYRLPIAVGQTSMNIVFFNGLENDYFGAFVSATWDSQYYITNKTLQGFTIHFVAPADGNQSLDWMVFI